MAEVGKATGKGAFNGSFFCSMSFGSPASIDHIWSGKFNCFCTDYSEIRLEHTSLRFLSEQINESTFVADRLALRDFTLETPIINEFCEDLSVELPTG